MKKFFFLLVFFCTVRLSFAQTVAPTWESIKQHPYPQWFSDAKLGIFIHWGLYSVPAYCSKEGYGEWYYRALMVGDSSRIAFQKNTYGKNFQYKDFDNLFKAELFNADDWAELFKESGAKYVVLVSKHHDGYCLWNSKYAPNWNSVNGGPKRDIVGELTEAVRKKGLKMGLYYSLSEWTNPLHRWMIDPNDSIDDYVNNYMIPQFKELIGTYKPSLVFTDGEWDNTAEQWHARELISWYYNTVGADAIVNDRWGHGADYGFRTPEYSSGIRLTDRPWAECRGLGRSFGLNRNEALDNYLTSPQLIQHFVRLVAAGGGLTLNVGPAADGKIPLLQQERLLDLGNWLKINGEAIYGTHPYFKFYEEDYVTVNRLDKNIDFDWVRNSPDSRISYDNFTGEWNGYIKVGKSDNYIFDIEVDDAASVYIDDKQIINYDPSHSDVSVSDESNVQEGKNYKVKTGSAFLEINRYYPIRVTFREDNQNACIKLFWSSSTMSRIIVDSTAFYCDKLTDVHGLNATYKCKQPIVCYTVKRDTLYAIALVFPEERLILNIPKPDKNTKVMLLGCEKVLPWKYKKGQMIIKTESLKYHDLHSNAAWTYRICKLTR